MLPPKTMSCTGDLISLLPHPHFWNVDFIIACAVDAGLHCEDVPFQNESSSPQLLGVLAAESFLEMALSLRAA